MENHLFCPKCKENTMERGYILDSMYGNAVTTTTKWSRGKPKKILPFSFSPPKDQLVEIIAYRCVECGYLELYAL